MIKIFGWLSTIFSLSYKIPQIRQLYRSHETSGLNLKSLYIQSSSYIFLIIHAIGLEDNPIILMAVCSLLQSIILVILYHKCHFTKNKIIDPPVVSSSVKVLEKTVPSPHLPPPPPPRHSPTPHYLTIQIDD